MDLDVMFECVEMFEILSSEDVEEVGVQMNSLACSFFLLQMIFLKYQNVLGAGGFCRSLDTR